MADTLTSTVESTSEVELASASPIIARISPAAVYPPELQGIEPLEDLWRRIRRDANGATYTKKRLTEEPDLALAITVTLNAALEREDQIKLHNQSRVFSEMLGRVFENIGTFLNTSLAPSSWHSPSVIEAGQASAVAPKESAKPLWKEVLVSFLTPKVFLVTAVAVLGLATGYSQVQIATYKDSIESFKSAAQGAQNAEQQLNNAKRTLENLLAERDTKILGVEKSRLELETKFIDSEKLAAAREVEVNTLKKTLEDLNKQLDQKQGSAADDVQKAINEKKEAESKLSVLQARLAEVERELAVKQEQAKAQLEAYVKLNDDYKRREKEVAVQVSVAQKAEAEQRRLEGDSRLLRLAEKALDSCKAALPYYRDRTQQSVYEAIEDYRKSKELFLGAR